MIADRIDLAVLKPDSTLDDVDRAIILANRYQVASLCVYPDAVTWAVKGYHNVSTVISFPFGYSTLATKIYETCRALDEGAKEIDAVINHGSFAKGDYWYVGHELEHIVRTCNKYNAITKVIIETCLWPNANVQLACQLVKDSGALFVKTSTGFVGDGSPPNIIKVQIMLDSGLKVKASGGIRTREQAERYLNMGCSRLGIGFNSIERVLNV